jgi:hypothetical protein
MLSSFLHHLLLACGLLLALPPGWCCMLQLPKAEEQARPAAPKSVPCCCCKKGAKPASPTPAPPPQRPARCPCADRHSTAPDAPKVIGCDLSCVAPLPTTDLAPSGTAAGHPVVFRALPSETSPHLLNCVWLC